MLLKLIKYDLKASYARIMLTFAIFTLLCIIAPPVLIQFQKEAAFVYASIVVMLGIMALFILIFVFLFQRYNSNFYSNEGYLMFSLPTNGKKLLASKLIVGFIFTVIAYLLMAASLGVLFYVYSFDPDFQRVFTKMMAGFQLDLSTVTCITAAYIIGTALFFLEIYFSISVAKLPLWHKAGVLMGFVTFFAVNILESIPGWFYNGLQQLNDSIGYSVNVSGAAVFSKTMRNAFSWSNQWLNVLVSVIVSVVLFFAISFLLDKKTSLK